MDKTDYAAYTLIIAILSSAAGFLNMGLSQPLTALVGKRVGDALHVGRCIAASRYYRDRLMLVGAVVLFFVLYRTSGKLEMGTAEWIFAWSAVVFTLYFQYWAGVYSVVFKLQRNLKPLYSIGAIAGLVRLLLIAMSYLASALGAPIAIAYGGVQAMINGVWVRRNVSFYVEEPESKASYQNERKELMGQCLPRVPSCIYHNISGQLSIFLIGYFGTVMAIAEVGALRRLSMLFLLLTAAGKIIVNPYFATVDRSQVFKRVSFLIAAVTFFSAAFVTISALFPWLFLWILGDGYQHLERALVIVVLTGCTKLLGDYFLNVILARKYVFKWFSLADVAPHIVVTICCILLLDLSTIYGVLYLGLAVHGVRSLSNLLIMLYGIARERSLSSTSAA